LAIVFLLKLYNIQRKRTKYRYNKLDAVITARTQGEKAVNFGQWCGFFSLILSLYVVWQIRQLVLLIFTAVIIATALNRLVKWLRSLGVRRSLALWVTVFLTFFVVFLFIWLVFPPFASEIEKLIELIPNVWQKAELELQGFQEQLPEFVPALPSIDEIFKQLQPLQTGLLDRFLKLFSNSLTVIFQVLLIIILALMMLVNPKGYRKACLKLFPSFYRQRADEILTECETGLGNWMGGFLIGSMAIATLSGLGLWILQVKLVLAHALIAGVLNLIPNVGPALSVIFPFMVALLDAPWKAFAVVIIYFAIQNIESYFLTPTLMAKQVSLLPAVTLAAQVFFATFFGTFGLFLAIPLTVVIKTWMDEALFKDFLDKWEKT
jgi:predicted PurR-regulated permease PerM